jgi:tetratricopeptide (TPR) repeat protein
MSLFVTACGVKRVSTSDKEQVREKDLYDVASMTKALIEIEEAQKLNKIDSIRAGYEKKYRSNPKDLFNRFLWAYSLDDKNEAWAELTKITKLDDKFYWAHLGMGIILDNWKVRDQAEKSYQKALEFGPEIAIGYARLGKMYLVGGKVEKALGLLEKAVSKSDNVVYQIDMARALNEQGKKEDALKIYRNAIGKSPDSFDAHVELADLLRQGENKDKETAVELYMKAASLDEKAFAVRFSLAQLQIELQRDEDALPTFQEACQLNPKRKECWQGLEKLAAKMGKKDIQIDANENILKVDPENISAHIFVAPIYLKRGEIERALPSFEKVLEKEENNMVALSGLATIFEKGGEFSKAIEYNQKVLALKKSDKTSIESLKRLYKRFHILEKPITGRSPNSVFTNNRYQIAKVYKLRLKTKPKIKGDMLIKVTVSDKGDVTDVKIAKNTVGDQVIDICAYWNLKRSKFPSRFGATYDFELTLKPAQ